MVVSEKIRTFAIDKGKDPLQKQLNNKNMKKGFYECDEHNRKNRKKAIEEMPYASKIVAVVGGYLGFESWTDYEIWKNQK